MFHSKRVSVQDQHQHFGHLHWMFVPNIDLIYAGHHLYFDWWTFRNVKKIEIIEENVDSTDSKYQKYGTSHLQHVINSNLKKFSNSRR